MVFFFFKKKNPPCSQRSVTTIHLYSCWSSEYDWASSQVCCHAMGKHEWQQKSQRKLYIFRDNRIHLVVSCRLTELCSDFRNQNHIYITDFAYVSSAHSHRKLLWELCWGVIQQNNLLQKTNCGVVMGHIAVGQLIRSLPVVSSSQSQSIPLDSRALVFFLLDKWFKGCDVNVIKIASLFPADCSFYSSGCCRTNVLIQDKGCCLALASHVMRDRRFVSSLCSSFKHATDVIADVYEWLVPNYPWKKNGSIDSFHSP